MNRDEWDGWDKKKERDSAPGFSVLDHPAAFPVHVMLSRVESRKMPV